MGYKSIDFKCSICEKTDWQLVTNADKAEEPCKNCGSAPKLLKPVIGNGLGLQSKVTNNRTGIV